MRAIILVGALLALCVPGVTSAQSDLTAWHVDGQTFLLWSHDLQPAPESYEIHASNQPFFAVGPATRIGRVYADNGANQRLEPYVSGARWRLPDGQGGQIVVGGNQAYFVATPRSEGARWFAVVPFGTSGLVPSLVGPLQEGLDPVRCHLQYQDSIVRIYGHWLLGDDDESAGRPDYAVMGNGSANGFGHNFAVWNPPSGLPAVPTGAPLVMALHGGGGDLFSFGMASVPGQGGLAYLEQPASGLVMTPDDPLLGFNPLSGSRGQIFTYWLGYHDTLNRFQPSYPGPNSVVVDYTARRLLWELEWCVQHLGVDGDRISVTGASMGGIGSQMLAAFYPERFSLAVPFVGSLDVEVSANYPYSTLVFGTVQQAVPSTLPGGPAIQDALKMRWRIENLDTSHWPMMRYVYGRLDLAVPWAQIAPELPFLDQSGIGAAIYWDQRQHSFWFGSDFFSASRLRAPAMTAYRASASYPGFFATDTDAGTPGRQPEVGDGTFGSGDPSGSWGGYLQWDPQLVLDEPSFWEARVEVISGRADASEITGLSEIRASLSPRRRRSFRPAPGTVVFYEYRRSADGALLDSGAVVVDAQGGIVVPDLPLQAVPGAIRLTTATGVSGAPLELSLTQPQGAGGARLLVRGATPGATVLTALGFSPAADGFGSGWAYGLALSADEFAWVLSGVEPLVVTTDVFGRYVLNIAPNTLPPLALEMASFEVGNTPGGITKTSGVRLFTLD